MRFSKKIFWFALLLSSITLYAPRFIRSQAAPRVEQSGEHGYLPGQVVVKLALGTDLAQFARDFGLDPNPLKQFGSRPIYQLRILDGTDPEVKATQMVADLVRVVYAEPNYRFDAPEETGIIWSVGDAYAFVPGGAKALNAQWAWKMTRMWEAQQVSRGAGVTVAVLDTGVDLNHPALAGHLVPGYDFVDADNDPSEAGNITVGPYGHGTHVAGLIAAVAPDAKIMPVRVLDQTGEGNIWVLAEAIAFAADPDGDPSTPDGAQVINLSLATLRRPEMIRDIIRETCSDPNETRPAQQGARTSGFGAGIVVVAAAGNGGSSTPEYPAALPGIYELIPVAASDARDRLASFSTRGSWTEVMAPGDGIVSSVPHNHYALWRGTSMSAPLVAGQAALIRATYPAATGKMVVRHIEDTARSINGEVRGRVDLYRSVTVAPHSD
jgi:subtilisin family serine protease